MLSETLQIYRLIIHNFEKKIIVIPASCEKNRQSGRSNVIFYEEGRKKLF